MKTTPFILLLLLLSASTLCSCVCQKAGTDCDCSDKEATATTVTANLTTDDVSSVKDIAIFVFDSNGKLCGSATQTDASKTSYCLSVSTYIGTDYTVCAIANAQTYGMKLNEVTSIVTYRTLFSSILSKATQENQTSPLLSGEADNVSIALGGLTKVQIQMKDVSR